MARAFFAATSVDWQNVLSGRINDREILSCPLYSYDKVVKPFLEIEGLGVSCGQATLDTHYYCFPADEKISFEEINRNDGSTIFCVDTENLEGGFLVNHGGIYQEKFFILGDIRKPSVNLPSSPVLRRIVRRMRRWKSYSGGFYIGPDCLKSYSHLTFTQDYRY